MSGGTPKSLTDLEQEFPHSITLSLDERIIVLDKIKQTRNRGELQVPLLFYAKYALDESLAVKDFNKYIRPFYKYVPGVERPIDLEQLSVELLHSNGEIYRQFVCMIFFLNAMHLKWCIVRNDVKVVIRSTILGPWKRYEEKEYVEYTLYVDLVLTEMKRRGPDLERDMAFIFKQKPTGVVPVPSLATPTGKTRPLPSSRVVVRRGQGSEAMGKDDSSSDMMAGESASDDDDDSTEILLVPRLEEQ
jgi:hypothetical protein